MKLIGMFCGLRSVNVSDGIGVGDGKELVAFLWSSEPLKSKLNNWPIFGFVGKVD